MENKEITWVGASRFAVLFAQDRLPQGKALGVKTETLGPFHDVEQFVEWLGSDDFEEAANNFETDPDAKSYVESLGGTVSDWQRYEMAYAQAVAESATDCEKRAEQILAECRGGRVMQNNEITWLGASRFAVLFAQDRLPQGKALGVKTETLGPFHDVEQFVEWLGSHDFEEAANNFETDPDAKSYVESLGGTVSDWQRYETAFAQAVAESASDCQKRAEQILLEWDESAASLYSEGLGRSLPPAFERAALKDEKERLKADRRRSRQRHRRRAASMAKVDANRSKRVASTQQKGKAGRRSGTPVPARMRLTDKR